METMTLTKAAMILAHAHDDSAMRREARRWICRHDLAADAIDEIVREWRRPGWTDEQEDAAFGVARDVLFDGPGWPQSMEEHVALMAEGKR